jgi:hypothetical protein
LTIRAVTDPLIYTIVVWISAGWLPTRAEWDDTTRFLLRYGRYSVGSSLIYSVGRLLLTGAVIAVIMTCGTAFVYGRSVLTLRLLGSDLP